MSGRGHGGRNRAGNRHAGRGRRGADPARRAAYTALRRVTGEGAYANLAGHDELTRLTGQDAAFATELFHGTCRLMGTYDLIIAEVTGRPLTKLQPEVLDVLRLAAHQVLSMRVADHAAVATSVELARQVVGERVAGLTNAVTRKILSRSLAEWTDQLSAGRSPLERLAITGHHPQWIVAAFADALDVDPETPEGRAELTQTLAADNEAPRTALAIRPGLATIDELVDAGAEPIGEPPTGAWWTGDPGSLDCVVTGRAGVQDPGSQRAALALADAAAPDGPWLDLCAGPGGKAALLAGIAAEQGTWLLASERAEHRAELVRQAVRAYPDPAPVLVADGTRPPWRPGRFAKVMADVPCSGLGALRRRPEARWRKTPDDLDDLVPLQTALLTQALTALLPGGVAAYVTCSPHRAETVGVIEAVLAEHPGFEVVEQHQLWPHRDGTDAMFCALITRRA